MNAFQERINAPQEKKPDIQKKAKTLTDDVSELAELYYRLSVITATEKASSAVSAGLVVITLVLLAMFSLLFAGIAFGWYLGEVLNSMLAGYMIVSAFFVLLILLTLALRKNFLFPFVRNTIIKKIYE